MIANHVHDALGQVRRLQELILEKRRFQGYSGKARIAGGLVTLAGAGIISSPFIPKTPLAHLACWMVVLGAGLTLNYGALVVWFFFNPEVRRKFMRLIPAADAVPALAIGAMLSLALVLRENYNPLFGVWMCLYGVSHTGYRLSLPLKNYLVGIFYMLAGTYCLLAPTITFTNPWPMGLVFCVGEIAGGMILYRNRLEDSEP